MTPDTANVVTQRIQNQLGAMLLQIIQLQAEKEAAEQALAAVAGEPEKPLTTER